MELQLSGQFKTSRLGIRRIGTRGEVKRITIAALKAFAHSWRQAGLEFIEFEAEGIFRLGNEKLTSSVGPSEAA